MSDNIASIHVSQAAADAAALRLAAAQAADHPTSKTTPGDIERSHAAVAAAQADVARADAQVRAAEAASSPAPAPPHVELVV